MKKIVAIKILLLIQISFVWSQELPTINQFYSNPYFYNPAFAGEEYRPALFIGYRQQWLGIQGAPISSYLSFHTPLGDNLAFGTNLQNDTRGLLNTSNLNLSIAYKVPFAFNHYVKFGLSAGTGYNQISDFDELINDPRYANDNALLNAVDNNLFLDGRFGFLYHVKGLNLSFALPKLLESPVINETEFTRGNLDPLNTYTVMGNYRFEISPNSFAFEPHLLYRMSNSATTSRWEAMGIFHLGRAFWLGGGYRDQRGTYGTLGLNAGDKFSFGYGYELAPDYLSGVTSGTHEVQLRFAFGEEKRPQRPNLKEKDPEEDPYLKYLENKENAEEIDLAVNEIPDEVSISSEKTGDQGEVIDYQGPTSVKRGNHLLELSQGHYVIVNVFKQFEKAEEYSDWLFIQGYFTKYGYSSQSNYYYVYIYYSLTDIEGAKKEKSRLGSRELFKKSWVLSVE